MQEIKKIIVSIHLGNKEIEVGELISEERKIYFKYYTDFIKSGLEISPFKLKLSDNIIIIVIFNSCSTNQILN